MQERLNGEGNGVIALGESNSSGDIYGTEVFSEKCEIPYIVKVLRRNERTSEQQQTDKQREKDLTKTIKQATANVSLPIMGSATDEERVYEPLNDVLEDLTPYKPGNMDSSSARKVENITSTVLTAVTNVGIVASVLILAMIGIKYMLGSVEEKAEYKKDLIPYVVGAFVVFGITTFIKIFMLIGKQITNI